jgi:hypothetical protein
MRVCTSVQVHEFVFYVFCEMLPHGHEMFGYFSREKRSDSNHLACILTMPHKQRKGYGGLIIDYSYKLARKENKPGTPERPLSDLGLVRTAALAMMLVTVSCQMLVVYLGQGVGGGRVALLHVSIVGVMCCMSICDKRVQTLQNSAGSISGILGARFDTACAVVLPAWPPQC